MYLGICQANGSMVNITMANKRTCKTRRILTRGCAQELIRSRSTVHLYLDRRATECGINNRRSPVLITRFMTGTKNHRTLLKQTPAIIRESARADARVSLPRVNSSMFA